MKPLEHAKLNVEAYGGDIYDYIHIHEFIDESKTGLGDKRHRAITHMESWMDNGRQGYPPSYKGLEKQQVASSSPTPLVDFKINPDTIVTD